MEKSKKISFTSIAIVVLAILLTVSLTMGGTLAWFANQNQADTTLTMGNAVGVAVVDNKGNGSMDRLSFKFNTGRNGELMLPGTQIDPNVQALIAQSNTNVILRAIVTFEVSLDQTLTEEERETIEAETGQAITAGTAGEEGRYFINVPSSIKGNKEGSKTDKELYLLNQMYTSFFDTLKGSALFNGWVYREANLYATDADLDDSSGVASTKYYAAGYTQYANTPIVSKATRNAGPERTQPEDITAVPSNDSDAAVSYNAFYFRGWASDSTITAATATLSADHDHYDTSNGTGWKLEDRGIDGIYEVEYDKFSRTGTESYIKGTGRLYRYNRFGTKTDLTQECGETAYVSGATTDNNQYAVLEGVLSNGDNTISKYKDALGYKPGDITGLGSEGDNNNLGMLNLAGDIKADQVTDDVSGDKHYTNYCWATAGAQTKNEDMMCVINTNGQMARIPLFTTSFILPTTWTQDAFADRIMKLSVTFQVMQADYLASGVSHHCSVELAESRFDDVTVWSNSQPFVADVDGQPKFNNPEFWNGSYREDQTVGGE